ncbi:hypothetical protein CPLU01_08547 [Colletotrichum plurivorum]|uniref:Uncharacterized protein n=1 Tax=Colletotrichum plurivorum TaxID=2175906 RepID=A0A8H6ND16_9PEZI|nr:hypothetical protein CPLU01_08547 [Colletotrichum plurivorum]
MHILAAIKRLRGHRHGTTDEVRMDPNSGRVFGGTQTERGQAKILSAKPNGTIGRDGTDYSPTSQALSPQPTWGGGLEVCRPALKTGEASLRCSSKARFPISALWSPAPPRNVPLHPYRTSHATVRLL